jgi:hypothetical protein
MSDGGVGGVGGDGGGGVEYNLDVEEISGGESRGSGNTDDSIGGEWCKWAAAAAAAAEGGDGDHEEVDR